MTMQTIFRPSNRAGSMTGQLAWLACALLLAALPPPCAAGADDAPIALEIRDHRFFPAELQVPAGEKCLLVIQNDDATAEEFESHSLHREKIIAANSKANVYIGPLKPGRYEFVGEFHDATARGVVIAR